VISKFSVSNFKAFGKEQEFTIKPITLVFGANSSGKSSFLHSLLYLHHLWATGEVDARYTKLGGTNVDLGGFKQLRHRGQMKSVDFSLSSHSPPSRGRSYKLSFGYLTKVSVYDGKQHLIEFGENYTWRTKEITITKINGRHPAFELLDDYIKKFYEPYGVDPNINGKDLLDLFTQLFWFRGSFSQMKSAITIWEMIEHRHNYERIVLIRIIAPLISSLCTDVVNTFWTLTGNNIQEFADAVFYTINKNDRKNWKGWKKFAKQWSEKDYEKKYGSLDKISDMLHDAEWQIDLTYPLLKEVYESLSSQLEPLENELAGITYLSPLRSYPSRQSSSEGNNDSIDWLASGDFAWSKLRNDSDLRNKVNEWLGNEKLGSGLKLETRDLYSGDEMTEIIEKARSKRRLSIEELLKQMNPLGRELVLKDLRTHTTVGLRDVGIGVAQVLPVLVRALGSHDQTHLIEQPELHLHPALQSELADVFIRSANSSDYFSSPANQFILETHSEHLILRILRRIRETTEGRVPTGLELKASDVSVIYIENTTDGSQAHHIVIAEDGTFAQPWPKGFFAERLEELL
jgi:hypothetical protein